MVKITTTAIPMGFIGDAFDFSMEAEVFPERQIAWTYNQDTPLPFGLTMDRQGKISGVPMWAQQGSVEFIVTTSMPVESQKTLLNMRIYNNLALPDLQFPHMCAGETFEVKLSAVGGVPPYQWEIDSLPVGLALSSNVIKGVPQVSGGKAPIKVTVKDHVGHTATRYFTIDSRSREE